MRIERLGLTRFGIFDGEELDLASPGVHVVVGPNEAGKTTAMTAIRQLFYGIPVRTVHDFVHAMQDLRIEATLRGVDGERLEIVRLKRNRNPLVDPAGDPIPDNVVARLLNDLGEEAFSRLFTIGHDEIARGGEALLDNEGELGAAVFGVRGGAVSLASVMTDLDARAAALFKKGGSKPPINAAFRRYKDASSEAAALSRHAGEVVALDEEIASLGEQQRRLSDHRSELSQRRDLLVQVQNSLRLLARRSEAVRRRDDIAGRGPLVPLTFARTLDDARTARREAKVGLETIQSSIEQLRTKAEAITVDQELLDQREAIEHLREALGENTKNKADLPGLQARADEAQGVVDGLVRRLPTPAMLDDRGLPDVTTDQRSRIEQLADRERTLSLALANASEEHETARRTVDRIVADLEALAEPADVVALRMLVERTAGKGLLEDQLSELDLDVAKRVRQLETDLGELGLEPVAPEQVPLLKVPSKETIRRFDSQMGSLNRETAATRSAIAEREETLRLATDELTELISTEAPPTPGELHAARSHRDEGWKLIRKVWIEGTAPDSEMITRWTSGGSLDGSYETAVSAADQLADRLWSGARAVARRAQLEATITDNGTALAELRTELEGLLDERERSDRSWVALWAPVMVEPGTPSAMEEWWESWTLMSSHAAAIVEDRIEIDSKRTMIDRHRTDLMATMTALGIDTPPDVSLAALMDIARTVITRAADDASRLANLEERLMTAEDMMSDRAAASAAADAELAEWKEQWADAVSALHLAPSDTPTTAREVLRIIDEIDTSSRSLASLRGRIDGIHERISEFTAEVRAVLERLPDHGDLSADMPEFAVRELSARLAAAADASSRRGEASGQLAEQEAAAETTRRALRVAAGIIEELVSEAGVDDEEHLAAAIERSVEHGAVSAEMVTIEDDLRDIGAGSSIKTVAQLEADAEMMRDVDTASELAVIDTELERIGAELDVVNQALGEKRSQRSAIDDSDLAARSASTAEQELAQLAELVDEYTRVVLARRLIEEQVMALREQSQGPLLRRASELFGLLTLGAYEGLHTDATNDGLPVVIARTADDRSRGVEALSTGTRDQLYLSLRLAALEQYMERNAPLPLVLDDLFVHFDDRRTSAGLTVLDELSEVTQVLLFTHHGHVADLAREAVRPEMLQIHELDR